MREIGSEFWNIPTTSLKNALFPVSTQWFLSGRSALQAILMELKGKKSVAFPSWCCESMVKPFVDAGMKISFYPVYYKDNLVQELELNCDVLFIMDYFGFTTSAPNLTGYNGTVIRDTTHSVFSYVYTDADYYFGSLRKWCGFWTGGYAWARDEHHIIISERNDKGYIHLRNAAMEMKAQYLQAAVDERGNNANNKYYLNIFAEAEKLLDSLGAVAATERDIMAAQFLDIDFVKRQRRKNAQLLLQYFSEQAIFKKLNKDDCPLFIPILVPDGKRDDLRNFLIQHDIYCPVHWPVSKYHVLDKDTDYIYQNELSLVCDQRYTEEDMLRIVELINSYRKES